MSDEETKTPDEKIQALIDDAMEKGMKPMTILYITAAYKIGKERGKL